MRIGIIANDIPPGFGTPCSALSLRALGLCQGISAHGIDCQILIAEPLMRQWRQRWARFFPILSEDPSVRIVPETGWSQIAQEYEHIVVSPQALPSEIGIGQLPAERIIYDVFGQTLPDPADQACLSEVGHVIANGPRLADHAQGWIDQNGLSRKTPVLPVACTLGWSGGGTPQPVLLIGGDNGASGWLERLAARFPDAVFVRVAHLLTSSPRQAAAPALPNIVEYPAMGFDDYIALNQLACGFLEIGPDSADPPQALSPGAVVALSCGCPVIHRADTCLADGLAQTGLTLEAGVTGRAADTQLAAHVERCLNAPGGWDIHGLWAAHLDPVRSIAPLVKALTP